MHLHVVALKDLATGAFMQPSFHHHPAHAVRAFTDEVNRAGDQANLLNNHPGDFELWLVATWNDQAGAFENVSERLARAVDVKKDV